MFSYKYIINFVNVIGRVIDMGKTVTKIRCPHCKKELPVIIKTQSWIVGKEKRKKVKK